MMVCIGKGILAGMLAAWILYQSVYGMVTVFIFIPLCIQREKKKRREQQKETLLLQFRDAMQSVAAALQAGYSMENAWRESEKEMTELYGQDGIFVGELHQINQAVGMSNFCKEDGTEDYECNSCFHYFISESDIRRIFGTIVWKYFWN